MFRRMDLRLVLAAASYFQAFPEQRLRVAVAPVLSRTAATAATM
jgi:hypothetical protein